MEKTKKFLTKYGLYILVVGIVLIIISNSMMSNLPNPNFLSPQQAQSQFYGPLNTGRLLKRIGIIGLLIGAFIVIKNLISIKNSIPVDTDSITNKIASSLFNNPIRTPTMTNNIPFGVVGAINKNKPVKSSVIEITKSLTTLGYEYVYTDEKDNKIIGLTSIINYFIQQGYRIVNTIESSSGEHSVMQIIIEK